jgi:hypothetical protein
MNHKDTPIHTKRYQLLSLYEQDSMPADIRNLARLHLIDLLTVVQEKK